MDTATSWQSIVLTPPTYPKALFPPVPGWSGLLVQQLLHDLCVVARDADLAYCEVGCYQGRTLLSAASSGVHCIGIEDYSQAQLGLVIPPEHLKAKLHANIRDHARANITLIEKPFEEAFEGDLGVPIGVFFYDGAHDYGSQRQALVDVQPHLANDAVIVVDDANAFGVREATYGVVESDPRFYWVREITRPAGEDGYHNGLICIGWKGSE